MLFKVCTVSEVLDLFNLLLSCDCSCWIMLLAYCQNIWKIRLCPTTANLAALLKVLCHPHMAFMPTPFTIMPFLLSKIASLNIISKQAINDDKIHSWLLRLIFSKLTTAVWYKYTLSHTYIHLSVISFPIQSNICITSIGTMYLTRLIENLWVFYLYKWNFLR